jgi:hypothetical protein
MSNEILFTGQLQFEKGGYSDFFGEASMRADMSGSHFIHNKQTIATTATALALGSVATPGYAIFKNHDSDNDVSIRAGSSGTNVIKVPAGKTIGPVVLATVTPYAIAGTAACELEYLIIEA